MGLKDGVPRSTSGHCRAFRFWGLLALCASAGVGWQISLHCVHEVATLFLAIAGLLLMWCISARPRLWATGLYLAVCLALLVRETLLSLTGRIPCGLPTFGSECAETKCVERSHIMMFETGCLKHTCVRTERHELEQVFGVPAGELHTVWLGSGLGCAWGALALSIWQLWRWSAYADGSSRRSGGSVGECVALVLAVPATYGLCAVAALRVITTNREDTWSAEAMMDVAELFSAVALYSFQRLLVIYVDSKEIVDSGLGEEGSSPNSNDSRLRRSFQRLISMGIRQYVFLVFGCNSGL
ncbi:unnamed protein product [Polarella glacialis]|uniref:Uncharacterized protein n=1 Tax=Polarella glacialis TaxID=89957 RepID=A0A813IEG2_POLGL|nr:unnamed protein product [Polarella glacialis]